MTQFNFNNRDSYLAYRADWKARYKAQSNIIRNLKKNILFAYKAGEYDKASGLQSQLAYQRVIANQLMEELREAQGFKNEQLAALAAVAA